MAKTTKTPPRKTIRARGALPTPKASPQRQHRAWHQRAATRVVAGVLLVIVVGVGIKLFKDFRDQSKLRKDHAKAVQLFERKLQVLQAGVQTAIEGAGKAPAELTAGTLPVEEYKKRTDAWLEEFRKLDAGLRGRKVPAGMPELDEARAILLHGGLLFVDATKEFQLAGDSADPAVRDKAVKQGQVLISRGQSLMALGQTKLTMIKQDVGLVDEPEGPATPIQLPTEDGAPPAPPPGAGAGGLPEGFPNIPGMPQAPPG